MTKTNIMVDFSIIGDDFDLDEITKNTQLIPTEQYRKGDKNYKNIVKKETCWSISTGYKETLFLSELLCELLDKFSNKEDVLIELKNRYDLIFKFFIVVNIEENCKPAIYLDNRVISFANNIGAEFDFDLYIMS